MRKPLKHHKFSYVEDENGNLIQIPRERKRQRTTLTRPHRICIRVVDALGVRWEDEKQFGRYNVDIFLPDYNIAVEVDGDYWHSLKGVPEKDARRDKTLLEKYGITTLRFKESEIENNRHKVESTLAKVLNIKQ